MESDIVARLRGAADESIGCNCVKCEAADEIERLREERNEAEPLLNELWERRTQSTEMRAEIERLRARVEAWKTYSSRAERDIAELRAERDEARRRVCENAIQHGRVYRRVGRDTVRCETAKEVAEMMGWDCFKEDSNDR